MININKIIKQEPTLTALGIESRLTAHTNNLPDPKEVQACIEWLTRRKLIPTKTWKEVDFKRKLIHVRSSEKFQTKTVNSERSIPMTKELYKLLTEMKAKSKSEYVFASTQGFQVRERRALQICKKVAENAKIKSNAYLHKFRHTYATILVQKGERLEDIKELLGHSTITETEIYAHHRSDQLHDRVIHLDNIFSKKKGQSK